MRLVVAVVGKARNAALGEAIRDYETRAARYWPLDVHEDVFVFGPQGDGLIRGQRPGRRGPDHERDVRALEGGHGYGVWRARRLLA